MPRPISNPPNPWDSTTVEWLGPPPAARLQAFEEVAKSALSKNESPDIPFRYSVNPYRGCTHACAYCYARRSHQFLGYGAGTDFDRKIVVKTNIHEVLARELRSPRWAREEIAFSGNTDCYQPLEVEYELTRKCLEACLETNTPVGIITKSSLVRRDIDLLSELARGPGAQVHVSIPFLDAGDCRKLEPGTPTPAQRFETLRLLSEAGIPTAVAVAPLIPGLNEHAIPKLIERAAKAGAQSAFMLLLRLASEVRAVFEERLAEAFPDRAAHVLSALAASRGSSRNSTDFGTRMEGAGPRWAASKQLFQIACRRHGLREGESLPPRGASRVTPAFELLHDRAPRREQASERSRSTHQPTLFDL